MFGSFDLQTKEKDTHIVLDGNPYINLGFRATIDRFNGRYFLGGHIPGLEGDFHIIDLDSFKIESHRVSVENIKYDFIKNRLVYEKSGRFSSLNLYTMKETLLDDINNGQSTIYAQNRTYIPQTDEYLFIDYIYGFPGYKYYILLDAKTGEQNCLRIVDNSYSVGGLTTNIHTGDIMFHFNGLYGFVNPCLGSTTRLSQIPDYHSGLNNQMVMYDHSKDTYIIPYVSKKTHRSI